MSAPNTPVSIFLPRSVSSCLIICSYTGIAKEGLDAELLVELVVEGELGSVVEGDGRSDASGQWGE